MRPWQTIERAATPDGAELLLQQRGEEFAIRVGGQLLMSSRQHGSEEEMARLGLETLPSTRTPVVLVGGLGMGFTLRAVLDRLPPTGRVVVAELLPPVVAWNRGPLAPLSGRALEDPRVEVAIADVRGIIAAQERRFDAILLDVDNGPAALVSEGNDALYGQRGLDRIHAALVPNGRVVVWSAFEDARFLRRLQERRFRARLERVGVRTGGKAKHVLFIGDSTPGRLSQ